MTEPLLDPGLVLREIQPPAPEAARALLAQTGIDPVFLQRWTAEGRLFTLADVADDGSKTAAAVALVLPAGARTAELRAIAGDPRPAEQLLDQLRLRLCREGVRRILAPVPSGDVARIALLQRAEYRPSHVERDAATPEHGYPAADPADLLWLERSM